MAAPSRRNWNVVGFSTGGGTTGATGTVTGTDYPQVGDWIMAVAAYDNAAANSPNVASFSVGTAGAVGAWSILQLAAPVATASGSVIVAIGIAQVTTAFTSQSKINYTLDASSPGVRCALATAVTGASGGAAFGGSSNTSGTLLGGGTADTITLVGAGTESNVAPGLAGSGGTVCSVGSTGGGAAANCWGAILYALNPGNTVGATFSDGGEGAVVFTGSTVPAFSGTASLSGEGTLSATASAATASGSAALAGSGTLSASPSGMAASGTAALSGSGTLAASPTPAVPRAAALSGSGSLTASGSATEAHTGSAALSGSGSLTAIQAPAIPSSAALSGEGTLSASGSVPGATPAPIAAYAFDEASGTTTADATGNGHTGTLTGSATRVAGHTGNAVSNPSGRTDGSGVSVPRTGLEPTTALTVMAWVRLSVNDGSWAVALSKGRAATGDSYALYTHYQSTGAPAFYINTTNGAVTVSKTGSLAADGWHHLAGTYDGAEAKFYFDGTLVNTVAATGAIVYDATDLGLLTSLSYPNEAMTGDEDDVRIFDVALTAAQITEMMNTPVVGSGTYRMYESASPPTTADTDTAGVMLAVEFYVTQDCNLTDVWWFQPNPGTGNQNTQDRTARIWRQSDGTLLASKVQVTPVGTGWQKITLDTPLALTANTRYKAGVWHPSAGYAATGAYYSGGPDETDGPLVIPKAINATAGQGTYRYTDWLAMPTDTFNDTNYWVDVTVSTGSGGSAFTGTAALSGSGTLTASPTPAAPGAAALSGSGSLTTTQKPTAASTAALSGSGALSTTAKPAIPATAALSGSGSLATTVAPSSSGTATLSGSGTLSTTQKPAATGPAALSGDGALTVSTSAGSNAAGTATLSGSGSLTAAATRATASGSAALTGSGALTTTQKAATSGGAALSGSGALTTTQKPAPAATVALSGSGALTTTSRVGAAGTATLTGSGTLTATGAISGGYYGWGIPI